MKQLYYYLTRDLLTMTIDFDHLLTKKESRSGKTATGLRITIK